ncbi:hypothetical protein L218DRAFT_947640 [Marasmius fiardii PR-910]|nr:hypothetical protein L218DRAFT_947640 [Marasmius fiardii PR-910]
MAEPDLLPLISIVRFVPRDRKNIIQALDGTLLSPPTNSRDFLDEMSFHHRFHTPKVCDHWGGGIRPTSLAAVQWDRFDVVRIRGKFYMPFSGDFGSQISRNKFIQNKIFVILTKKHEENTKLSGKDGNEMNWKIRNGTKRLILGQRRRFSLAFVEINKNEFEGSLLLMVGNDNTSRSRRKWVSVISRTIRIKKSVLNLF